MLSSRLILDGVRSGVGERAYTLLIVSGYSTKKKRRDIKKRNCKINVTYFFPKNFDMALEVS